ncbi:hypothetical protein ElyMa_004648100 [Elysia marginata]|uniref:Uncharacterized protein n=1 Tax=Elysia marginata TaxID=1093978 RepID=A0AAV4I1L9_9GAST|nr:hypothetical protein ElyMa_004648100 [Elysia marginata]
MAAFAKRRRRHSEQLPAETAPGVEELRSMSEDKKSPASGGVEVEDVPPHVGASRDDNLGVPPEEDAAPKSPGLQNASLHSIRSTGQTGMKTPEIS